MTDPSKFKVTPINTEQLKVIIDDPTILSKFGWDSIDDVGELASPACSIEYGDYKLAFVYWESDLAPDIYEVHILCPKDSIKAIRVLSLAAAGWLFSRSEFKLRALVADCPVGGTLSNMARKLGGIEYKREAGKSYFILPSPYLNKDTQDT